MALFSVILVSPFYIRTTLEITGAAKKHARQAADVLGIQ
jgi:hypothetical protein